MKRVYFEVECKQKKTKSSKIYFTAFLKGNFFLRVYIQVMQFSSGLDFIGDIHGHVECLSRLLLKMGYKESKEGYFHPEGRQVVFLGDYIDRGPDSKAVYRLVRSMVESKNAVALLGNHELNALAFWTKRLNPSANQDSYYREHSFNKVMIHAETVTSFHTANGGRGKDEFYEMLNFFRTLPLYLETETFRAMHACADLSSIALLKAVGVINLADDSVLHRALDESLDLFKPIDMLLKGPEMELPEGITFRDSENVLRYKTRITWWENPSTASLEELSLQPGIKLPNAPVPEHIRQRDFYRPSERPVFFGHYWLEGSPYLFRDNVCCLDFSVASRYRRGKLAAYRFDGEQKLSASKIVYFDPLEEY